MTLGTIIDDRCKECKKDWTKCGCCPVTMEWVKQQKEIKNFLAGSSFEIRLMSINIKAEGE